MAVDGKVVYEVDYNTTKAKKSIKGLNIDLKATGEKMSSIGSAMTQNVTLPIVAGAGAAVAGFMKVSESLVEVRNNAIGIGAGVEGLQALQHAGRSFGIESDKMTDALKKTQELIATNERAFWDLGIATRDVKNKAFDTDVVFMDMLNTLSGMDDVTRDATATSLGFTEELVAINQILADSKEFQDQYKEGMENAISEKDIKQFDEFNKALEGIKSSLVPVATQLALVVLPYFQRFAEWFEGEGIDAIEKGLPKLIEFVEEYGVVIAGIAAAGPVLSTTGKAISGIGTIAKVSKPLVAAFGGSLGAVASIAAVAVLGFDELEKGWEGMGEAFSGPADLVKMALDDVDNSFEDFVKAIAEDADGLYDALNAPLNAIIETINTVANAIADLTGKSIYNIPKMPELGASTAANRAFATPSQATVGGFRQAEASANALNINQLTMNVESPMTPGNVKKVGNEVMEYMSTQLQTRRTWK